MPRKVNGFTFTRKEGTEMRKLLLCIIAIFLTTQVASAELTSYIDEHNRFILNGEPFFPIGLYVVQSLSDTSQLDEIASSPFDTLMNYNINSGDDIQITNYLNQLETRNLNLIFSLADYFDNGQADIDTITQKVNTFKIHPAIISWYLNDERDPATYLTQLEERYAKIRELDENHPVWSVHWNTDWVIQEVHTTDIVGVDPYPIGNHPITLVSQMADAANASGKPLWLVPQIFSWTDYPGDPRAATGYPPTKEEMRAMTYLAVNHGAKGLIYYSYFNIVDDPDYDTRWPQIKGIASEIDQLRPVFLSIYQTNVNDIVCDNADIDFKLMREGNTYYLFAVNTKEGSTAGVSFQINLVQKPAVFDTLFEGGRQISVVNGKVTDDFDVYQVHVYSWDTVRPVYIDIKANHYDGPLSVTPYDSVEITVALDPGDKVGERCDWWVGAFAPFGTYWLNPSLKWVPSNSPIRVGQWPLFDLSETSLRDTQLPEGVYMFFFLLDDRPDGTFGLTWYDYVNVICQSEAATVQTEEMPDFDAVFRERMQDLMR